MSVLTTVAGTLVTGLSLFTTYSPFPNGSKVLSCILSLDAWNVISLIRYVFINEKGNCLLYVGVSCFINIITCTFKCH